MRRSVLPFFVVLFMAGGPAFAGSQAHKHEMPSGMKKQHQAMSSIGKEWTALTLALKKSDLKAAGRAAEKILGALPALDDFKLHKNKDKYEQLKEYSAAFREDLTKLKEAINARDLDATRALSATVQSDCDRCHKMFR